MTRALAPLRRAVEKTRIASTKAILPMVLDRVEVDVRLPDDRRWRRRPVGAAAPRLIVHDADEMIRRLAGHPKIGLGEAYTDGIWDAAECSDLADALTPFAATLGTAFPPYLRRLRRLIDRPMPAAQRNSRAGSKRNIEAHYDLSNELFTLLLDDSMTYSAALFAPGEARTEAALPTAQQRKIDAALDRAHVGAGTRLLEIGTGWGALAIAAAKRGAQVTSITLSTEQAELARQRVHAAGVEDLVDIRVEDYRDTEGKYDAIISIEMIEAVGEEFWPDYFTTLEQRLGEGGTVVLQSILMDDERLKATRSSYGWIQKHIFPGGLIPSLPAIESLVDKHTTLDVTETSRFGPSYADTLRLWRQRFDARVPDVLALGFDERFVRTWRLYLAYSEAGFRSRYLDVAQIKLHRWGH